MDQEAAEAPPAVAAAPAAAPLRPSQADVRTRVDLALLATSEQLDISPRGLRQGLRAVLESIEGSGSSVAELRALM